MTKVDLKRDLGEIYSTRRGCRLVDVPEIQFLMVDGEGDPNTAPAYADAVEALYATAYKVKFIARDRTGIDSVVMPLEGLWWVYGPTPAALDDARIADRSGWRWTMMIAQPDHITRDLAEAAIESARRAKPLRSIDLVRLESFTEGKAAQVLHLGPYAEEWPTIRELHSFIDEQGFRPTGKHHEIYLSDPRRSEPSKLRTLLRQPVG
jgi:hypothetical protein